jgi:hypothetical protein
LLSLTDQDMAEGVLDRFIKTHNASFCSALGYKDALSQHSLKIIDNEGLEDRETLIPDYLMVKQDGTIDILDLKTAALKKHQNSLLKGGKARCRFKDYVGELIAQLYGYRRYFEIESNLKWFENNFGLKVHKPKLIGIVGNYDNFQREEIDLAMNQYKDDIVLYSYAELINFLRTG